MLATTPLVPFKIHLKTPCSEGHLGDGQCRGPSGGGGKSLLLLLFPHDLLLPDHHGLQQVGVDLLDKPTNHQKLVRNSDSDNCTHYFCMLFTYNSSQLGADSSLVIPVVKQNPSLISYKEAAPPGTTHRRCCRWLGTSRQARDGRGGREGK